MMKAHEITEGLQSIVNSYSMIAIIWHVVFILLIVALIAKWEPSNRLLGTLFCFPVLSVAILAWISGNPFNGSMFSILAILVIVFGLKAPTNPISLSQTIFLVTGILMVVFGLFYPHFLGDSYLKYIYAAPVGLIPCPTLSILIGFLLIYGGFGSHPLQLIFIIFGLFYGVFGVLKLGVTVDLFLVFGTAALIVKYVLSFKAV